MKTTNTILLAAALAAGNGIGIAGAQQGADAASPPPNQPPPVEVKVDTTTATNAPAPADASAGGTDGLRLNFNNVPLDMVLKYLSDAAGFHIILDTQVHGNVTVISSHPMSKDEAVVLLNAVLNRNGYAAIRDDQFLTIVDKADAKNRNVPVVVQSNPALVPNNDIMVTQIIPLRYVEATQLVKDLSPFVSQSAAAIVANDAGNSIVITDTQANIKHLCEIIQAIDSSAEASTEIRVIPLAYANPSDVASLLASIFPSQTSTSGNQTPIRFGGGPFGAFFGGRGGRGGGGGGGFGGAQASGGSDNERIRKQSQVIAVADLRTSSVVITAQKDLMDQIVDMIKQLDVKSSRDFGVYVYHLNQGDPQQAATVLQGMFPSTSTSRNTTSSSANSALMTRETQNASSIGTSSSSSSSTLGGGGNNRIGGAGGGRSF